jgi:hypothetical protein
VSLIARHLEAHGIPTVIMGCARDIVEHAGVPRFLWSDFPLGNSAGRPNDVASQRRTLALALDLFETATGPRTTLASPERWAEDDTWQADFMNIDALPAERIEQLKAEFQAQKQVANTLKRS